MTGHLDQGLLRDLALGHLPPAAARRAAEHVDTCPRCAAAAAAADPLGPAWASLEDPEFPHGLVDRVLEAAATAPSARPPRGQRWGPALAVLAAGTLLAVPSSGAAGLLAAGLVRLEALGAAIRRLPAALEFHPGGPAVLALALLFALGFLVGGWWVGRASRR